MAQAQGSAGSVGSLSDTRPSWRKSDVERLEASRKKAWARYYETHEQLHHVAVIVNGLEPSLQSAFPKELVEAFTCSNPHHTVDTDFRTGVRTPKSIITDYNELKMTLCGHPMCSTCFSTHAKTKSPCYVCLRPL